jgi:hypothetical protein
MIRVQYFFWGAVPTIRNADDADAADHRGSDKGRSAQIRRIRVIRVPITDPERNSVNITRNLG